MCCLGKSQSYQSGGWRQPPIQRQDKSLVVPSAQPASISHLSVNMSDDSEGEEPPVLNYYRISATAVESVLMTWPDDFLQEFNDRHWHIKSLLGHQLAGIDGQWQAALDHLYLEYVNLKFFSTDGRRRTYTCYMDEDGIQKLITRDVFVRHILALGMYQHALAAWIYWLFISPVMNQLIPT